MAKVFIVAEHRDGRLKKSTFELVGASSAAGNETHAILLGEGVADLAKELAAFEGVVKNIHSPFMSLKALALSFILLKPIQKLFSTSSKPLALTSF